MKNTKKKIILLFSLISILALNMHASAATTAGQELRTQVLYLTGIIDNDNFMNDYVTRGEFAKMIVKASAYKDSALTYDSNSGFADVANEYEYSPYIKIATREGYITSYLMGLFKPLDYVTYKDLVRSCLSLLTYKNDDFTGNQVSGRYETFCALKLNSNIDKELNDFVTKKDCINAIYNTLKTKMKDSNTIYGTLIFEDLSVNSDGDLNATGLSKASLDGPFILKKGEALNLAIPFDITKANIFINGTSASLETVFRELGNNGYLIYY